MTAQRTRPLHPLQKVQHVEVSEEQGPALGNPHYFWMARRYTMTLQCGHQQSRVRSNFEDLPAEDFMPKAVRCMECPATEVPVKDKPAPKYDHLASTLVGAILGIGSGKEQDAALSWVQEHGDWITSETARAATYGAVAVFLLDVMLDDKTVRHADTLRKDIETWAHHPTAQTKDQVRKTARRLYNAQKSPGNDWFAARALICLGRIPSMGTNSAEGVVESLTWDRTSREGFYERLWEARYDIDLQTNLLNSRLAAVVDLQSVHKALEKSKAEFADIWNNQYPKVAEHHLPLLMHLLNIYADAKTSNT